MRPVGRFAQGSIAPCGQRVPWKYLRYILFNHARTIPPPRGTNQQGTVSVQPFCAKRLHVALRNLDLRSENRLTASNLLFYESVNPTLQPPSRSRVSLHSQSSKCACISRKVALGMTNSAIAATCLVSCVPQSIPARIETNRAERQKGDLRGHRLSHDSLS